MSGKIRDDPIPMSVRTVCAGDENNGVTLPHLDEMDIITLNHDAFIHTVLGFRISFVVVIFHHVAAATIQEYAKRNDKNGAHSAKSHV
jgi:hypothetical protein